MKRLIKKSYNDVSKDIRDFVIPIAPLYPAFPDQHKSKFENNPFQESDEKSYSKMMNDHTLKEMEKKEK